jgi:hypothetical protein
MPKKARPAQTAAAATNKPAWPALQPPYGPLRLQTVVDDQILLIPGFWSSKTCAAWVTFIESLPLEAASGKPKRDEAARTNDRLRIEDPNFAAALWTQTGLAAALQQHKTFSAAKGLNGSIRLYRYRVRPACSRQAESDTCAVGSSLWTALR